MCVPLPMRAAGAGTIMNRKEEDAQIHKRQPLECAQTNVTK